MSEDKDRFGDKMRKREKAEEDRYFAREDKDKLEKIHDKSAPAPQLGNCPKCGVSLRTEDHLGVSVDRCSGCDGVWLDRGELETLHEREDEGWPTTWFRSILSSKSS